jgi:serine phosphatase RsbU (regulator of sigma subunit)/integral membrane sensor domain MASE1/anti-sigma regulatory factor (Ser/Thr protein kinase)
MSPSAASVPPNERSGRDLRPARARAGYVVAVVAVALLYIASGKLGLDLAFESHSVTAIWPPTGIALAALILGGYRLWPAVALGALLTNVDTGVPAITVAGITCGNTLEALAGTYLLRRVGFRPSFPRVRDVFSLVVFGAALSTLVSASIGVTSLLLGDAIPFAHAGSVWRTWWLGDMGGDLIVAPALLVAATHYPFTRAPGRVLEAVCLAVALAGTSVFVFSQSTSITYVVFPLLTWAALRFWQPGATFGSLLVASIAVAFTANGQGPFAMSGPDDRLLLAQTFVAVAGVTALVLAVVTSARRRAERVQRRIAQTLQQVSDVALAQRDLDSLVDELTEWITSLVAPGRATLLEPTAEGGYAARGSSGLEAGDRDALETLAARVAIQQSLVAQDPDADDRPLTLGVPLRASGEVAGVLVVSRTGSAGFSEEEIQLIGLAAERASLAIDRARVFEREHRIAETLQRSLLPERLPELPGLEVAARYLPAAAGADVGGDWYDCVPLRDGSMALVMGDVVGRGVDAAALVGKLRNALLAYALEGHPAAEVVARLNRFMFDADERPMATLLYTVYRPGADTLEIVSAGHPPPLVRGPNGTVSELSIAPSVPLGAYSDTRFDSVTVPLERGSMLALYTDGLVERRQVPIDAGIGVLAGVLAAANGSADRACEDVVARLVGGAGAADDVAVLVLRVPERSPDRLTLQLPARAESLAMMRRALRQWFSDHAVSSQIGDAALLTSGEAASNAVEHAGTASFELDASIQSGVLELEVRDHGRWRPPRGEGRGRGMHIVEQVADSVEIRRTDSGTMVCIRHVLG